MQTFKNQLFFFSIPILLWISSLIIFNFISDVPENRPAIASGGLNDVWFFYLPLMGFTLCTLFFFTKKRELPSWDSFAVNKKTIKKDLLLAFTYLTSTQLILGGIAQIGLHFPGPNIYTPGLFGLPSVIIWVCVQTIFYIIIPYVWLRSKGFRVRSMLAGIRFKRDIWIMLAYWVGDFFGAKGMSGFDQVSSEDYVYAVPLGIIVNLLGAGLPVLIMIHVIIIPRLSLLLNNQLLVIIFAGMSYTLFSLFDPGVDYSTTHSTLTTLSYVFMTQTLIGMGKAAFTVRTGNPFIHLTSYHILGARVAFDTPMYAQIFKS